MRYTYTVNIAIKKFVQENFSVISRVIGNIFKTILTCINLEIFCRAAVTIRSYVFRSIIFSYGNCTITFGPELHRFVNLISQFGKLFSPFRNWTITKPLTGIMYQPLTVAHEVGVRVGHGEIIHLLCSLLDLDILNFARRFVSTANLISSLQVFRSSPTFAF